MALAKVNHKYIDIKISTMDADMDFPVKSNIRGKSLFELLCKTIGLREYWYFGLTYFTVDGMKWWLRMEDKVIDQIGDDRNTSRLFLMVKFYPEDVEEEIIQEMTQHLFFLQVQEAILNMDIFCPAEASVLLASFALQAKYGDYDEKVHQLGFLSEEQLLPKRVTDQYQLTAEMWEEKIVSWYATYQGMSRCEAEIEYLKIAQDLEMFAINYFSIKNKKSTELWIGIHPTGISVYNKDNKLMPVVYFIWSEIENMTFKNKKFTISSVDKVEPNFIFYSEDGKFNRQILDLSIGSHDLYMRRRKPDTMEVQQMKSQAKEERLRREKDRQRYFHEKELRIAAQRENEEMRTRLEEYQTELESYRESLLRTEETTNLLAEKARIAEEESALLLRKAAELENEIFKLNMSMSEKEAQKTMLEGRIRERETAIRSILDQSEKSMKSSEQLKDQLQRAREAERNAKEKLIQITSSQTRSQNLQFSNQRQEYGASAASNFDNGPGIVLFSSEIQQERLEYLQKSKDLQKQLSELKSEIEGLKVAGKQDILELMHSENVEKGESKYSTLKKVTESNGNARVQFFERL
eukprot:gene14071-15538_t